MEKGQGKGTDTLQTDNVFKRKEYIEREAVKSAIYEIMDKYDPYDRYDSKAITALQRADDAIDLIPAADVVPVVRGKWINQRVDSEMCSACGVRFYVSALFAVGGNDEPNYCPNCGAKMMDGDGDG